MLGAGDAFASGFLYGFLQGWPLERAARMGNACGAIVVTRHGCANFMPTLRRSVRVRRRTRSGGDMSAPRVRLTMAQALVRFLSQQRSERDGREQPFFGGVFGIFGHGNVAGIGQALQREARIDFATTWCATSRRWCTPRRPTPRCSNRLRTLACTSSIGPGATNMITGARRRHHQPRCRCCCCPATSSPAAMSRRCCSSWSRRRAQDVSVNDCFKPVSRYWDRIYRPEQLITALPEVMRVLTSPAETGAVTLALPQDVQAEAYDYPEELFEPRVWMIARAARGSRSPAARPRRLIRASRKPLIVAGGGVIYSEATDALRRFVDATGIAVGETQAGKGALPDPHPLCARRRRRHRHARRQSAGARRRPRDRHRLALSDFTTASKTAFQNERVRFININVAEFDAYKHGAVPLVGDARVVLDELQRAARRLSRRARATPNAIAASQHDWRAEVDRVCAIGNRSRSAIASGASRRSDRRPAGHAGRRPTSSSAPPAACPAICTSCGARAIRRAITWSTATRAWATRSPAASA